MKNHNYWICICNLSNIRLKPSVMGGRGFCPHCETLFHKDSVDAPTELIGNPNYMGSEMADHEYSVATMNYANSCLVHRKYLRGVRVLNSLKAATLQPHMAESIQYRKTQFLHKAVSEFVWYSSDGKWQTNVNALSILNLLRMGDHGAAAYVAGAFDYSEIHEIITGEAL